MTNVFGPDSRKVTKHPKSFFGASLCQSEEQLGITTIKYGEATARLREVQRLYTKRIRRDPSLLPGWLKTRYADELAEEMEEAAEKIQVVPFYWVTISSKPGTDVQLLKAKAAKAFTKKWITSVKYTFEIGEGGNPHVHALVGFDRVKHIHEVRREFQNTFKTLGVTANNVEVKSLTRLHMKNNLGYMCKNKPSDVLWRSQNFLPPYVETANFAEKTQEYTEEEVDGCLSPLDTAARAVTADHEGVMWAQGSPTPDPTSS